MLLSVFEKYIFLQSLGWGIANSLWQALLLWAFYQLATTNNKKLSALFKYHFSLILLVVSFAWFISTVFQNYISIKNAVAETGTTGWFYISATFTNSLQWLSIAYFIILSMYIFQFAKKMHGLFVLKNSSFIKAPVDIRLFAEQAALHIGIKKKIAVWLSEKAQVPSVIGFLKPIVLLPFTMLNHLSTEQAEAVILHELAHIKRNDFFINLIQCCIETLLFFNPFVKLLGTEIRKERENCCDDWVMNYRYNKHDYAAALMILEQHRTSSLAFALAATNGKKNLLGRVKRLFEQEPTVHFSFLQKVKMYSLCSVMLLAIFFVLPLHEQAITDVAHAQDKGKQTIVAALPKSARPAAYFYYETEKQSIVKNKPAVVKNEHKKQLIKTEKITVAKPEEIEYTTALVNQELLHDSKEKELQEIAVQAANKELQTAQKIFVTIEEEESGKKDKNTYLVEVNNNNGNPEVKPLIILNKKMKTVEKIKAKNKINKISVPNSSKKRVNA